MIALPKLHWTAHAAIALWSVAFASFLASLVHYWQLTGDALDRYLVVAGTLWIVCRESSGAFVRGERGFPLGLAAIAPAFVLLPMAWFLQLGDLRGRAVLLWCQWAGVSAAGLALGSALGGRRAMSRFAFPVAFLALAIPLPTMVIQPVMTALQGITTGCSHAILVALGESVERSGFVLKLPRGLLGVEEACSGIKSLVALTAIAAFLAYLRRFGLLRGAIFVACSLPVVLAINVIRVVASAEIQERIDPKFIVGGYHDALGFALVLLGLAVLVKLAGWIGPKPEANVETATPVEADRSTRIRAVPFVALAMGLLVASTGLAAWQGWRLLTEAAPIAPIESVRLDLPDWPNVEEHEIDQRIRSELNFDTAANRTYRSDIGDRVTCWVIAWTDASKVKGYHHPDLCLPTTGWTLVESSNDTIDVGRPLPVQFRRLKIDAAELAVIHWAQEGRLVQSDEDERIAAASLGVRGLWRRLVEVTNRPAGEKPKPRLVVSLATTDPRPAGISELKRFAGALALRIYAAYPDFAP